MFVLTIFWKIKETRLKFSYGSLTVFWNIGKYEEARANLRKLKSEAKNKTRIKNTKETVL